MTTATAKIRLQGVRKAFGPKVVLDGLDLTVQRGESLVVLGGSGTGKSVLLKHMIGLMQPDAGTVEVDGIDLATLRPRALIDFRRRFGMAFQEGALFDSMTVRQNIAFPLERTRRFGRRQIDARVDECLGLMNLPDAGDKLPSELSGGMRRRVGFARAIALRPEILLFDEPTSGLDPVMTAVIDEVILSLRIDLDRRGTEGGSDEPATLITITHDLTSAFRIADRIAFLHGGQVVAIDTPQRFRAHEDPRIQQFLQGQAEGPLRGSAIR